MGCPGPKTEGEQDASSRENSQPEEPNITHNTRNEVES